MRRWKRENAKHVAHYQREYQRPYKGIKTKILLYIKQTTPCADCGQQYPHYVTDFDHVRGVKRAKVAECTNCSWRVFLEELIKCDLVCANCHRLRTFDRGQYGAS